MVLGEFVEEGFTVLAELETHHSPVVLVAVAGDQFVADGAVHQFDHGMVAKHQAVGRFANRQALVSAKGLDREQQLVLLRIDPAVASSVLTEGEEAADGIAELVQGSVVHRACGK